nr:oxidoreductase-like domain-containing protein [Burkholderia glumae]
MAALKRRPSNPAVPHTPDTPSAAGPVPASSSGRDDPRPLPPVPPELEDCCQSGCAPCVFDLYDDALQRYRAELAAWRERHPDAGPS